MEVSFQEEKNSIRFTSGDIIKMVGGGHPTYEVESIMKVNGQLIYFVYKLGEKKPRGMVNALIVDQNYVKIN